MCRKRRSLCRCCASPPYCSRARSCRCLSWAAPARIIAAARDLFARHGVGGTSLQMIADEIGVTKAAVYHQYKTKDEIVLAAAETELALVRGVVESAEAEPTRKRARDVLLNG